MTQQPAPPRFRAAPFLLVLSLIVLALTGTVNQRLYRQHWGLLDRKAELQDLNSTLRAEAATVSGPIIIGNWARAQGMVPAPQVDRFRQLAPEPVPPVRETAVGGLEVHTVWR